jgi:predicted DNA-binding protein (MmcQ/YjbR family)
MEWIRQHCLSLAHATEQVQWEDQLVFKIGGKMFAMMRLGPPFRVSFKVTPEEFQDLTEKPAIIPAPYLARAQWVALESSNALSRTEIKSLIASSYKLVLERLPKKVRLEL